MLVHLLHTKNRDRCQGYNIEQSKFNSGPLRSLTTELKGPNNYTNKCKDTIVIGVICERCINYKNILMEGRVGKLRKLSRGVK